MRQYHIVRLLCALLLVTMAQRVMAQDTDPIWSEQCDNGQEKIECRLREPLNSYNACFPVSYVHCCGCTADLSRCYACSNTSDCAKEACLDRVPLAPRHKGTSSFDKAIALYITIPVSAGVLGLILLCMARIPCFEWFRCCVLRCDCYCRCCPHFTQYYEDYDLGNETIEEMAKTQHAERRPTSIYGVVEEKTPLLLD